MGLKIRAQGLKRGSRGFVAIGFGGGDTLGEVNPFIFAPVKLLKGHNRGGGISREVCDIGAKRGG